MSSFAVSVRTVFFECPLRWFRRPAGASLSRWSSSSALRTRSASAFFSSSKSPSLLKTSFGALALPYANTEAMQFHLNEVSLVVAKVLLLLTQVIEQYLGISQIGRLQALGEPMVDW